MTKNFILCLYVIIFNPSLVFGNNPFSTKLTSNQKKVELAEKKFDFDTAKSLGSVQTTSDVAPGNLNFRLVGIVSKMENVQYSSRVKIRMHGLNQVTLGRIGNLILAKNLLPCFLMEIN